MPTTLLSSKGQLIIPKAVRESRGWKPGTRLTVEDTPQGVLLRQAEPPAKRNLAEGLEAIRRRISWSGPAVSIEAMDAAVLAEAARRPAARKQR